MIAGGILATGAASSAVYLVDPSSGRVRLAGRLATAVGHASAVVLGGAVYITGGLDSAGGAAIAGTRVDPVTATITSTPLSVPVADAAVAEANGEAFLIGGRRGGRAVAEVRILGASLAPLRNVEEHRAGARHIAPNVERERVLVSEGRQVVLADVEPAVSLEPRHVRDVPKLGQSRPDRDCAHARRALPTAIPFSRATCTQLRASIEPGMNQSVRWPFAVSAQATYDVQLHSYIFQRSTRSARPAPGHFEA